MEVAEDSFEVISSQHDVLDRSSAVTDHSIEEIYVKEEPVDSIMKDYSSSVFTIDHKNLIKRKLQIGVQDNEELIHSDEILDGTPSSSKVKSTIAIDNTNELWPLAYFLKSDEEVRPEDDKEGLTDDNWEYDTVVSESGVKRILVKQMPLLDENLRIHQCLVCNKSFKHISHLYHHIRSVHERVRPHTCDECKRAFSRKTHLTNHILSVHEKVKPHKCEECDSLFSQKAHLLHHILSVHKKIKTHTCGECDSAFSHKSHLLHHIQSIHEKVKPHKCDECDGAFSRKSYLSHHILTVHRKVKPYKCTLCDSGFSHKSVLCHHILAVHQNKKASDCKECAKGYSQKAHLSRHILSAHKNMFL